MKAKTFLSQLQKIDRMIINKIEDKERWKAIATGTTACISGERVQSSVNPHKMENAICNYIDKDIDKRISQLIDKRNNIIGVIEKLDSIEYDVLYKIYVQHLTFNDVAEIYGKSYSWVTTIHGQSLKSVQEIIDKMEITEDV